MFAWRNQSSTTEEVEEVIGFCLGFCSVILYCEEDRSLMEYIVKKEAGRGKRKKGRGAFSGNSLVK